jgi:hypothetical protein
MARVSLDKNASDARVAASDAIFDHTDGILDLRRSQFVAKFQTDRHEDRLWPQMQWGLP